MKETIRDIDARTDFDENGVLKDPELKKHFAEQRKALLGEPVGTVVEQTPVEAPARSDTPKPPDEPKTPVSDAASANATPSTK